MNHNAAASFNSPSNDPLFVQSLTSPALIELCKKSERVLPSQAWSADDEADTKSEEFGWCTVGDEWRKGAVKGVLREVEQ